jgi:beta-glucosidase
MSMPDYKRSELSVSLRLRDLLRRMTPEEKARQLDMFMGSDVIDHMRFGIKMDADANVDPAKAAATIGELGCGVIHDLYPTRAEVSNDLQRWFRANTRLGIPVLLVEEGLHGFNRADSTVFPQCIGLGATFDPDLVERVGAAIAAEMRTVGVHLSLSPVLCLARDPRWGRAEETFGEDPWLAGSMGKAYVRGMQGDLGPLNVVAEPKHFAGHGSPQGGLNQGPVHIGEREMREVMLKAFRPAFVEGRALGAMCAYHEIDGIPCAANPWLLTDLLRGEWGFEGVVISDLGAIRQLLDKHLVAKDARDAICQALRAGVDIQFYDFDHATWMREISAAYRSGQLETEILDRAVSRVLALKFRLGLFDRPETDPERHANVCRCPVHLDLSLEAARKSLVLLKNDGGLLPLRPGLQRVALLGPSAAKVRLGDYSSPGDGAARTLCECLRELMPQTEIVYEMGVNIDGGDLEAMPEGWLRGPDGALGLRGAYFADGDFEASPDPVRQDVSVNFNWAIALAAPGLPSDGFGVRWTGSITPDRAHHGCLGFVTSDQVRVWIDGSLVMDAWDAAYGAPAALTAPVDWRAGQDVEIRIDWRKRGSGAVVWLGIGGNEDGIAAATAAAERAEVAILALGESDKTSGEGIDRCDVGLPGRQGELLRAVLATGTPTVVVLQNGRPLAVPEIAARAPAVLEAWFPGERGGQAIAEALLGILNPGGRLPVSVPRHVGQLPLPYDRKPSNQGRYVELDGSPLWPFGFGLSYTTFAYADLSVSKTEMKVTESIDVACTVINTGHLAGDEVVQLYLSDPVASVTRPLRWLAACARVTLEPGESRRVTFRVIGELLELWSRERRWVIEPGEYRFSLGGGQAGQLHGSFQVVA